MKYDVIQKVNGDITVISSWNNDKKGAKQAWHHQCELLYSDADTPSGSICEILDDNLEVVDGKKEIIDKN